MECWLYSHLLGEEFALSDTPSPLQLPEGLHSTAGDTWPCSSGALQPKQGHLLRAESWHQEGLGLGRKIFTLYSFSVNQHWLEKPSNLFSLGTAEPVPLEEPPLSPAGCLDNTFLQEGKKDVLFLPLGHPGSSALYSCLWLTGQGGEGEKPIQFCGNEGISIQEEALLGIISVILSRTCCRNLSKLLPCASLEWALLQALLLHSEVQPAGPDGRARVGKECEEEKFI